MLGFEEFRRFFPILEKTVWLDHAGTSPLPLPTKKAYENFLEDMMRGDYGFMEKVDDARRLFAELVGCDVDEVALMPNTSYGIIAVSTSLKYKPGANVVTTDLEFPSVVYTWLVLQKRGILKVRFVRSFNGMVRVEDFERLIDDNTAVVSVSHVEFQNGWRNNLKSICEIAHKHGAYVLDDAVQAVGAIEVDVKAEDIDFLAAGGYKWLLSPMGTGYLYVKRSLISELETPVVGHSSTKPELAERFENRFFQPSENARRFEIGTLCKQAFAASTESLKILLNAGPGRVERRIAELIRMLRDGVEKLGVEVLTPVMDKPSGILTFKIEKPEDAVRKLRKMGIAVSARGGGVRVSPHFYNDEDDVERFIKAVKYLI